MSRDREHAEQTRDMVEAVLVPMGLRLSEAKTLITHIDEGLDFLGWRSQRHRKRGTDQHYVYTYPAKKALRAVMAKVKAMCRQNLNHPLEALLHRLNPVLRGWAIYFRPGVSSSTFQIPVQVRLGTGDGMDPAQTPKDHLEGTTPTLLRRRRVAR